MSEVMDRTRDSDTKKKGATPVLDEAGNILPYWAWALQENRGGRAAMVDVYFQQLPK